MFDKPFTYTKHVMPCLHVPSDALNILNTEYKVHAADLHKYVKLYYLIYFVCIYIYIYIYMLHRGGL